MSFDSSRFTFNPWNDYLGVVMQQGRVQLDEDWNEWVAEFMRRLQAGTLDIVGPSAVPRATTPNGFNITPSISGGANVLSIGRGRIYVDGLLAENHGLPAPSPLLWTDGSTPAPAAPVLRWDPQLDEQTGTGDTPYDQQPYYFAPMGKPLPATPGPHVVYLDVWQRELTHLQAPDLIEKAVNVDTTERLQTVWQVKVLADTGAGTDCGADLNGLLVAAGIFPSAARLTTDAVNVPLPTDPCQIPASSGYKGLENQLYRVEIHQDSSNAGGASFKWSRDNATIATLVPQITAPDTLVVESVGRDDVLRFNPLDWIEITDDWQELNGVPGEIHQIKSIEDATRTITLQTALVAPASYPVDGQGNTDAARHTRIRRWDQSGKVMSADGTTVYWDLDNPANNNVPAGTIPLPAAGAEVMLENGVLVSFSLDAATANGIYASKDFWAFAARTVDGTVEKLTVAPPRGIHHHYTQLAVVTFPTDVSDCRTQWPPVSNGAGCCCGVTVGPSDLTGNVSLQSILDQFKAKPNSVICLEPGNYSLTAPLVFTAAHSSITLKGCGAGVNLSAKAGSEAAFRDGMVVIVNASGVSLQELQFAVPEVPFAPPEGPFAGLPFNFLPPDVGAIVKGLVVSIGVRAINSTSMTIKDCAFDFGDFEEDLPNNTGFAVGVFGGGQNDDLRLEGNTFAGIGSFMAGYLLAPAVAFNPPHIIRRPPRPPVNLPGGVNRLPAAARTRATAAARTKGAATKSAAARKKTSAQISKAIKNAKPADKKPAAAAERVAGADSVAAADSIAAVESFAAAKIGLAQTAKLLRNISEFVPATENVAAAGGQVLVPTLTSAVIKDNDFSGMNVAVLILAEGGEVDFADNEVADGGGGLWAIDPQYESFLAYDSAMLLGGLIAGGYPLPSGQAIAMTAVNAAATPVRFYAGAEDFTDSAGDVWTPDTNAAGVGVNGGILNRPPNPAAISSALPDATDQALYQDERYGNFTYTISNLADGYYQVRLKFAEIFDTAAGQRVFNVYINDKPVLQNFDVFVSAGGANIAFDETFADIIPQGGQIVIQFEGTASPDPNPKIAAVEVASQLYQYPSSLNEAGQFLVQLSTLASQPYATAATVPLDFSINANHMEGMSGAGMLLLDFLQGSPGSVTMNGNVVRLEQGKREGVFDFLASTALLVEMGVATVTGNQLLNPTEGGLGLLMFASAPFPHAAVTGNVLQGTCILPARDLPTVPAPMNTWKFMNTLF